MMIIKHTVETTATPKVIWGIWEDVGNWNKWDHGIEYSSIDGPLKNGATGTLKPRGGPLVKIRISQVEPLKKFVDESKLFCARMIFTHDMTIKNGKTYVTHQIEMKGLLAPFFSFILGRKMKKDLPIEMAAMVKMAENEQV